ncbi:GPW/gp25 family protein [Moorena sp. SIO3A5]|uniref:GPW/gp25 family protein n=1 Tax=Moorena sp. SIO3A5 TaxID=2607822 RepID=UPI0025803A71|nr:GPW/gp25 family protein [Moorena sp. SIO3A5]
MNQNVFAHPTSYKLVFQISLVRSQNSPSAISHQRSAISDQRSAISHQPSAISDQRSAISHQPSAISDQRSAISHQPLPITYYLLPITHYPLPITHYPLPITYYPSPITHSPFPIPHSRFPIPDSPFPIPHHLMEKDLLFTRRHTGQFISERQLVDLKSVNRDLATATGLDNLAQAILNRLYTRKGELAALGHPNYGSRLHLLVGQQNNNRLRSLANLYIRECLAQEPRIEEIKAIDFEPPSRQQRYTLVATVVLKAVGQETPLTLSFSLPGG